MYNEHPLLGNSTIKHNIISQDPQKQLRVFGRAKVDWAILSQYKFVKEVQLGATNWLILHYTRWTLWPVVWITLLIFKTLRLGYLTEPDISALIDWHNLKTITEIIEVHLKNCILGSVTQPNHRNSCANLISYTILFIMKRGHGVVF